MPRFSLEKTVSVQRENIYEVLSNFENYQKLLPQHFPSVRIRSVRDNVSVAEEHMNLGDMELVIMAKHVTEAPMSHDIFVIGGDAKGSHIRQQFVELSQGTKIIVDVDLKLKGKMRMFGLFGKKFEQDYAKILDDFIKIAEI